MATDKNLRHIFSTQVKQVDPGKRIIEGWASTANVDRQDEIVEPQAFTESLPAYMKNPIMFFGHAWYDLPIGKVIEAEVADIGLRIKAQISETAEKVWKLIEEEILRSLSIGFQGQDYLDIDVDDRERKRRVWKRIELLEISVVNIPANPEALFEAAKGLGIGDDPLFDSIRRKMETKNERGVVVPGASIEAKTERKDGNMGEEKLQEAVATIAPAISESLKGPLESIAESTRLVNERLKAIEDERQKEKEELDAVKKSIDDQLQIITRKTKLDRSELEGDSPLGYQAKTPRQLHEKLLCEPAHDIRSAGGRSVIWPKAMVQEFQEISDIILVCHTIMKAPRWQAEHGGYGGVKSLKLWPEYSAMATEFRKAMDSLTATEGLEWIPTLFSAEMIDMIDNAGRIPQLFRTIPMTGSFLKVPSLLSRPTFYKVTESIDDNATKIPASNAGTGAVTFTPVKGAARVLLSYELEEEAIIAAMPIFKMNLAKEAARSKENAIVNGDTTATHMDTGYTVATNDQRRYWNGLRDIAHNTKTAGTYACTETTYGLAAFEESDLRRVRHLLGKYGVSTNDLVYITSLGAELTMQGFTKFATADKFGALAANLTGALAAVDGSEVVTSEFVKEDLNASGIYDGSTTTSTIVICVNKTCFAIGDRRQVSVETDRNIETQQDVMVISFRADFQDLYPAAADCDVGVGYGILSTPV